MRSIILLAAALALSPVTGTEARTVAIEGIEVQSVALSAAGMGALFSYDAFDTQAGARTLDRVRVEFGYVTRVDAITAPNMVTVGSALFPTLQPVPYVGQIDLSWGFDGFAGRGFRSLLDSATLGSIFATGRGGSATTSVAGFTFFEMEADAASRVQVAENIAGSTFVIEGGVSDFLQTPATGSAPLLGAITTNVRSYDPRVQVFPAVTNGALSISYYYTKRIVVPDPLDPSVDPGVPTPPDLPLPAPVPLPAGLPMLLAGLGALGLVHRARARRKIALGH